MQSSGKLTKKAFHGKKHIKIGDCIPIPPLLKYNTLQSKIKDINVSGLKDVRK